MELKQKCGLSHLDLKLDNVVIKSDFKLALIDFAHATQSNRMTNKNSGTNIYLSPEVRISRDNQ